MTTTRWRLQDAETGEVWTMPINPDSMSPIPVVRRQMRQGAGGWRGDAVNDTRVRTFVSIPDTNNLEWSGVIRTKQHYDDLVAWAEKPHRIRIYDHLDRRFTVIIQSFEPTDRRPTKTTPWRLRYTMKAVMVERGVGWVVGPAMETDSAPES